MRIKEIRLEIDDQPNAQCVSKIEHLEIIHTWALEEDFNLHGGEQIQRPRSYARISGIYDCTVTGDHEESGLRLGTTISSIVTPELLFQKLVTETSHTNTVTSELKFY